eukprot:scaffold10186_cov31-Tisochrysis_lutea.AAC.1
MHLRLVAKKETSPSKTYGAPKLGDPPPDPPGHMGASSKNLHFLYTVDKDFNLAPSENLLQAARGTKLRQSDDDTTSHKLLPPSVQLLAEAARTGLPGTSISAKRELGRGKEVGGG